MLSEKLKECGVVGAGGAGFPTYVKAKSTVEFMLANGAECEPLLHKDFELMCHYPKEIVSGMALMMEAIHAKQGKFGIKEKNHAAIEAIRPEAEAKDIELAMLGDFYPSGDEYELVYSATGRLIPAGGIPLQVGCVVNNVETLYNVHFAAQGVPVTRKMVSVSGAVRKPKSFWVPIGTPFRDLIALAGGATTAEYGIFVSGLMMGTLTFERGVSTLGQQIRYARELSSLAELAQRNGAADDPLIAERLTRAWVGLRAMRSYALATMDVEQPGQDNVSKLLWANWHRDLGELAMDVIGRDSMVLHDGEFDEWQRLYLFTRSDTIYGGSNEIQRNIIAERVLGLPREAKG